MPYHKPSSLTSLLDRTLTGSYFKIAQCVYVINLEQGLFLITFDKYLVPFFIEIKIFYV